MTRDKGTKIIYRSFIEVNVPVISTEEKWKVDLELHRNHICWRSVYKICFYSVNENILKWFQLKIIRRILATNSYLKKVKVTGSDLCRLCGQESETLLHLFVMCPSAKDIWLSIQNWINAKLGKNIVINRTMKILGYTLQDKNFWCVNFILLCTRFSIFSCATKNNKPNFLQIQKFIKLKFDEQELLSKLDNYSSTFSRNWQSWKQLLENLQQNDF